MEIDYGDYIENMMEVDWKNGEIIWRIDKLDLYEIVLSACHEQSVKNMENGGNWNKYRISIIFPLCLITSQPTDSGIFAISVNVLKSFKQCKFYLRRRKNGEIEKIFRSSRKLRKFLKNTCEGVQL